MPAPGDRVRGSATPAAMAALVAMLVAVTAPAAPAQDWSAHLLPLVTHASPAAGGARITEAYLSQPILGLSGAIGPFTLQTLIDLEGWTLRRGELNTGAYGEGFVDRRHPHAYLHELMITMRGAWWGTDLSSAAGRGVVPFGTDDPMMRPALKYPVNHHLAQVLERAMVASAARHRRIALEVAMFGGEEPTHPGALPRLDRFGDSWSARLTTWPTTGLELSASRALVRSPEIAAGGGLDHHKSSLAVRADGRIPGVAYALVEWARTDGRDAGQAAHRFESRLVEAARCDRRIAVAARLERTDRPEEERLADPTRTVPSPTDFSLLGITTFTTATITVASATGFTTGGLRFRPMFEAAVIMPRAREAGAIVQPLDLYGTSRLWMISAGVRMAAGRHHARMGRYGAAAPSVAPHTDHASSTTHHIPSCFAP